MTNTELLRFRIKESGYKMSFLAKEICVSPYGFQRKVDGLNEFTASEIKILSDRLGLSITDRDVIFFAA